MSYEHIIVERRGHVGLITLNRPKALNALCAQLVDELGQAVRDFDKDDEIRALVITGSEKAFAAGADINEMADKDFKDVFLEDFITDDWEALARCRKPTIAAVAGYALGGGCELAMMADIILAADNAKFGQPEITIGTIPGSGGTQRLTRAIGKSRAMEMVLTGRQLMAEEAAQIGLVSRVVAVDELIDEAVRVAAKIADMSMPAVFLAKEAIQKSFEMSLTEGVMYERRLFHASFALEDRKEGMAAFQEKRSANYRHR